MRSLQTLNITKKLQQGLTNKKVCYNESSTRMSHQIGVASLIYRGPDSEGRYVDENGETDKLIEKLVGKTDKK